jgi:hypothetical protein
MILLWPVRRITSAKYFNADQPGGYAGILGAVVLGVQMFRTRTMLRGMQPIHRNLRNRQSVIQALQCMSFRTAIAPRQGNEPHGYPMDDLPKAPIVNPADKYKEDSERLHEYGMYILTCLPKFIQKFRYETTEIVLTVVCGKTS